MIVSIIIPVFNTKYEDLLKCLDSILAQTFPNFEVIIIDDGSEDYYGNRLDELVQLDSRISVFHKKNEGVSVARNFGVNKATGQYILFVDGDDILWATCTAPLVFPKQYKEAISLYYKALEDGYDSLVSMEKFKRYLWDDNGPINYELGIKHVPSQQLKPLYFVTDGILLAPRSKMIEWKYFHGSNPYRYILDKRTSIDIDDGLDLACARAWLDMDESVSQIDPYSIDNYENRGGK